MKVLSRFFKGLHDPKLAFIWILERTAKLYPMRFYIIIKFRIVTGYWPNLKNPQTFNEKLNWAKLNNQNPLYTLLADKIEVKNYVREKIGGEYVVPSYGVWDTPDEIDFDSLPDQFVIKCNHCSGHMVICKDKASLDIDNTKKLLWIGIKDNYYWICREWPYKNIHPRIVADMYLEDGTGTELRDYKFWCFNGVPKYMYCTIKGKNVYENFYDMDFNPININHGFPRHWPEFTKPSSFDTMKSLSAKLSQGIPFVRVDFFDIKGKIYFGEFTFFDWGAFYPFASKEMDMELGALIEYK